MTSFSRCSILAGVIGLASIGCTAGSNGAGGGGAGSGTQANTTSGFTEATTGGTFSSGTQATNGSGGGCAGTSIQAQKAQLDLFIMLDQSGSMSEDGGNGKTKWVAVTDALKTFVDLPQVKWAKSEFKKGKGLSDVASTARQKQFGPDWIASDLTGEGWKKFDSVGSGKLTTADIVERAYCERVLGKTKDSPGRKKQLTMDDTFHGACIFKGKKKVDTNAAVGDYLARNLTVPRELRIVYLLWAIPGGGGVAMDSFPLGATFHRYPNVKKQKNPTVRKTLIYVRKNGKMVATSQKLTWFYGFISYPMGDGKSGHAHGWVLKNVLARAPKPKK